MPDAQAQFDTFQMDSLNMPTGQYNLYLPDNSNMANNSGTYYPPQPTYSVPQQPVSSILKRKSCYANYRSFNTTSTLLLARTEKT
jgi:hypothetical protein